MNPWLCNLLFNNSGGSSLPVTGQTFYASLKTSLVPEVGTGAPTWSRATKAWGFNELGYLEELASGCAFFGGARLVRNLCTGNSDNFSGATIARCSIVSAAVTNHRGTNTAVKYLLDNTSGSHYARITSSAYAGLTIRTSVVVRRDEHPYISVRSGQDTAPEAFNLTTNAWINAAQADTVARSFEVIDATWIRLTVASVVNTGVRYFGIGFCNSSGLESWASAGTENITIADVSICDVTGYDASYIPEYVSVGVSRNEIINTEDPSNASWTMVGGIGTKTAIITDGPNGNQINVCRVTVGVSATGLRIQGSGTVTSGAKISGSVWVRKISGSGTQITMDLNDAGTAWFTINSVWQQIQLADISHASVSVKFIDTNISTATWTTGDIIEFCYPQYNYGSTLNDYTVVGGSYVYDGAGIDGAEYFETDWQGAPIAAANLLGFRREASAINNLLYSRDLSNAAWSTKTNVTAAKTATGLDGIANTATTLTATAADAIILQPITLASAARCASAYVKRRTGTGTISFTQDGGSTWTDITSLINSSTWSRVQITSTLANPSVGFKISTSGDAIDVDCVQNEAGAVATSPIVTTTTTITRNADSLTYQTSGNIDFAVGTLYHATKLTGASASRYPVIIGSSHLGINSSQANTEYRVYDGTTVVSKLGLDDATAGFVKRACSWGSAGLKVTGNGAVTASGAFNGSFGDGATISIASNLSGYVGPVAIYNYQMTDAELQAITT